MIGPYVVVCLIVASFACLNQSVALGACLLRLREASGGGRPTRTVRKREFLSRFTPALSTVQITGESATAADRDILYSNFAARYRHF